MYQYSMDNKDGGVHGWISSGPVIGFWVIFPSHEFRNGGPTKQNLTVHTCPPCLDVCSSVLTTKHFSYFHNHAVFLNDTILRMLSVAPSDQ